MLSLTLRIVACVLLALSALGVVTPRINLMAAGLACWVASSFPLP